jgi:hypothetical protein
MGSDIRIFHCLVVELGSALPHGTDHVFSPVHPNSTHLLLNLACG